MESSVKGLFLPVVPVLPVLPSTKLFKYKMKIIYGKFSQEPIFAVSAVNAVFLFFQ